MTILEFVKKYNDLTSDKLKDAMLKSHIKRNYCPVIEKRTILQMMLDSSVVVSESGIKYIDMMTSRINYTVAMVVLYTDLTVDTDEEGKGMTFNIYDALVESGLISKICEFIGLEEVKEFSNVNSMLITNFEKSEGSLEAFCASALKKFVQVMGDAVELIEDPEKFKDLTKMLSKAGIGNG